jgi:hypothetical protein
MMFYCPNCKKLELGKVSYSEKEYIASNCRDGWGYPLHYVICKECNYPLSTVMYTPTVAEKDEDEIQGLKYVIEGYQNGMFQNKKDMLLWMKNRYKNSNRPNSIQVINACDKYLNE